MTVADRAAPATPEEVVSYLLEAGLLTVQELVDGDVRVEPISARNRSMRVIRSMGSGYFMKQAEPGDESAGESVAREAAFYRIAMGDGRWAMVREVVPGLVAFDQRRELLTVELVADACNAHELDDADGPTAFPRIGRLLGEALAACHSAPCGQREDAAGASDALVVDALPPPWILEIARPVPQMLRDFSSAQLELVKHIQGMSRVCDALAGLHTAWAPSALVHGDIKWGNVLVRTDAVTRQPVRLWIVDWEFASWGDPAWDLGSAMHGFLADGVHAISHDEETDRAAASAAFNATLPAVQEQLRQFWGAYAALREGATEPARELVARAVRSCGARLLQSAYEWSYGELAPPRNAVAALQLGVNILQLPVESSLALLGLGGEPGLTHSGG